MTDTNTTLIAGMSLFDKIFSGVVTDIVIAMAILLIGFIIGNLLGRVLKRLLYEFKVDPALKKSLKIKFSMEKILSEILSYSIYFISIVMTLNHLGVTSTILNIISIALIVLIAFSILLALKDLVPNFIAGIKIIQKEIVKKGDNISFDKIKARVVKVTWTETKLESKSGDIIFIPNSLLLKKILKVPKRKKKKQS